MIFKLLIMLFFLSVHISCFAQVEIKMMKGETVTGDSISENYDSTHIKIKPGIAVQISNNDYDNIFENDYYAKNNLYIDFATVIFSGYINLNFERMITKFLSLKFGYGFGYYNTLPILIFFPEIDFYSEYNLMLNLLIGKDNSKFDIGLGASYFRVLEQQHYNTGSRGFSPAISLGYRYQPRYGGLIFRFGGTWLFGDGDVSVCGLHFSLGYTF